MKIRQFELERYFAKYEFEVPYLLCGSDCESMSVKELLDFETDAGKKFEKLWLGYTESKGSPELRQEIARLYTKIGSGEILVHAGAEEAIFIFMNAALSKGDHIIVHTPCYQSLYEIAFSIGCEITKWETKEENNWEFDIEFLKSSIRPNTKAIIINCPHNPTGYLMSRYKLDGIIALAGSKGILVFSDEVYRLLEFNEADRLPAACDIYENAVSLGVMSKTFGLAGLRIGWIATRSKDIFDKMAAFKDYTSICNSAPSEFLSIFALRNKEKIVERNMEIILRNINILNDFFGRYREFFNWYQPKAGSIAFPSIKMDTGIEEFCDSLVKSKGVLLLPGNRYDYGNKNFRIGFGRKNLTECIEKLDEYMKENY